MPFFRTLDSPSSSNGSIAETSADPIPPELFQWANAGQHDIETKIGLDNTGRIVLDIIKNAQRAKRHREECTQIADQVYHLVNAIDGGVKGRAIDVNPVLHDHIKRLNQDLECVRQKMKGFTTWWIFSRTWRESSELQTCQEILDRGMQMYVLLLRGSIMQPPGRNRRPATSPRQASRHRRRHTFGTVPEAQGRHNPSSVFQHPDKVFPSAEL
ncbi:hypothetical protein M413DRAFT_440786 [Hebeloma cylindrosporum]|uniref:Uncharacterized protein n=1 Tax=Hebeloma cylindrosporum TaxID=76867 RepID=A0A0C3CF10_HEBCY|nr:hypothetical protein M413DRAFT_440786 [Hebeloma cylindrosporum h7]